ncbi:transporter [Deferribacterales bacterium]|nr:transporter [Deferribacterales bacterium]
MQDAVASAIRTNEDVTIAELTLKRAEAVIREAKSARWFNVEATGRYQRATSHATDESPTTGYIAGASVNLVQPLFTFGTISNAVKAASIAGEMAQYQHQDYIRELTHSAKVSYYQALLASEQLRLAELSLSNALNSKRLIENSSSVRIAQSDYVKISSDIAMRMVEVEKARLERDRAHRLLSIICGYEEDIVLSDKLTFNTAQASELSASALQVALKANPTLNMLAKESELHEASAKAAFGGHLPTLSLLAGWEGSSASDKFAKTSGDELHNSETGYVGVQLSVPLLDGGRARAQAAQKRADALIAKTTYNKSLRYMKQDLVDAVERYNRYLMIYQSEENAIKLADRSYNMSLSRFRTGQTSATELNDAEQGLSSLRLAHSFTIFSIYEALSNIEKLVGGTSI